MRYLTLWLTQTCHEEKQFEMRKCFKKRMGKNEKFIQILFRECRKYRKSITKKQH